MTTFLVTLVLSVATLTGLAAAQSASADIDALAGRWEGSLRTRVGSLSEESPVGVSDTGLICLPSFFLVKI